MGDTKISNYTELTSADVADELVVVDKSDTTMAASGTTKKITHTNLLGSVIETLKTVFTPASASAPASLDLHEDTDNGTNKITITAPSAVASGKTLTLPDATDTLVGKDTTDTLTNKTLTSPTISSPVVKTWNGWQTVDDSWSYASADSPTFTITVPSGAASLYSAGMRIKLTQTTVKYFIITAVTDTVLTVYGGTDYTLANATISDIYYSTQKAPYGFPLSPLKWSVKIVDTTDRFFNTPTQYAWNNCFSFSVPIGKWNVNFSGEIYSTSISGTTVSDVWATVSDANNNQGASDTVARAYIGVSSSTGTITPVNTFSRRYTDEFTGKTTQYVNIKTSLQNQSTIHLDGSTIDTIIEYVCAYL